MRLIKGPKCLGVWSSVGFCNDEKIFELKEKEFCFVWMNYYNTLSVQRLQEGVTWIVVTRVSAPPPTAPFLLPVAFISVTQIASA